MAWDEIYLLEQKIDKLAKRSDLTAVQRTFIVELCEELMRHMVARQAESEIRTDVEEFTSGVRQYIDVLRTVIAERNRIVHGQTKPAGPTEAKIRSDIIRSPGKHKRPEPAIDS